MKYHVGRYVIAPEKPFPNMDEAVRYIQKKFPELERETIEKFISPPIVENGKDKSGDISEEDSDGKKDSSEDGPASPPGIKAGKDKSGQSIKR